MKRWAVCGLCLLVLGTGSCEWFPSRQARTRQLVDAEMQGIDWNQLDQFPLFDACDETASKADQQECFQKTLTLHLSMALQDFDFRADTALHDTLYVDFLVDNQGGISVLSVDENQALAAKNPEFENIVSRSLRSLPRLQPALKRGIPVAARFRLPLVVKTDE